MKKLKREDILAFVLEEIKTIEIDEMARARTWETEQEGEPFLVNVPTDKIATKNPETGEVATGSIYVDTYRISPVNGKKLVEFVNYANGNKLNYFSIEQKKFYANLPRNPYFGTAYRGAKMNQLADVDPDRYQEKLSKVDEEWAKRNVLYPGVTQLFNDSKIKVKMYSCGLPVIAGGKDFTEPTTVVGRIFKYTGPELNFELHSTRDEEDVQSAMAKVIDYREKLDRGEQPDDEVTPRKHVRKYGGRNYSGGEWNPKQRADAEKHHHLTDIYKLHKKAVQGGEVAYTLLSELKVKGEITEGNTYYLKMDLDFKKYERDLSKSRGENKGRILTTITVFETEQIPEGKELTTIRQNREFFEKIYGSCLKKLGAEILQINPDDTLPDIEPDEDEFDEI